MRLISAAAALLGLALLSGPTAAQQGPSLAPAKPTAKTVAAATPPVTPPAGGAQLTRPDVEAWLDGYMPYALQRGDVAGAVVVVVKDGQVLLQKGYGYADVASHRPVDPNSTLFRPGSVSKLFTWTALMQLVEQGKVDLDADVNTYLDFKIPLRDGKPVTVRNLMTHTPGFEESIKGLITSDPKAVPALDKFLSRAIPHRIFPAGQVPAYSNYGAALAGYIVQRVSGQSFEDYTEQHIFRPLGMAHTTFRQPLPANLKSLSATGYNLASGKAMPFEIVGPAPAGSSSSSGADMARFMLAHLQGGSYNGAQILRPETVRLMHQTPYTAFSPNVHRMLLGFYEIDRNGHRILGHGGDTMWFHSEFELFPDDHVGVFISVNSVGKEGAAHPIRAALMNEFTDRYFPGPAMGGSVSVEQARKDAAVLAGAYESSRRPETNLMSILTLIGQAKVVADADGRIMVSDIKGLNGQPKLFTEVAPFVWRDVNGKDRLAAKVVDGKVVMFGEDEGSPFSVYLPAPAHRNSGWLLPLLYASLGAIALTAVLWPTAALVRRRYGASFPLEGVTARSFRWVRIASLAALLTTVAWIVIITSVLGNLNLSAVLDPWVMVLHLVAIVVLPLAALVSLWNVYIVWTTRKGGRSWFAKLWSIVLAISCLTLLYVGIIYHLIGLSLTY